MSSFQIVPGWWRHQPGQRAVGGVRTAHDNMDHTTIIYTPLATNSFSNTYMVYTALLRLRAG